MTLDAVEPGLDRVPGIMGGSARVMALGQAPVTLANLTQPEALAALRALPTFRLAAESFARAAFESFEEADPHTRWLVADLGRTSLYVMTVVLDGLAGGLTVANLKASAATYRVASPGRVTAFVERCLDHGGLKLSSGTEPWTRRQLRLTSAFIQPLGRMLAVRMRAVSILVPDLETAADQLNSDAAVTATLITATRLTSILQSQTLDWLNPLLFFMGRNGGMRFMEYLLARQTEPRVPLLQSAQVNISQAARACDVSRRHLDNMIADAAAAGLLRQNPGGMIEISTAVSEALEDYYAVYIRVFQLLAQGLTESIA